MWTSIRTRKLENSDYDSRLRWEGNVSRMNEDRNVKQIFSVNLNMVRVQEEDRDKDKSMGWNDIFFKKSKTRKLCGE